MLALLALIVQLSPNRFLRVCMAAFIASVKYAKTKFPIADDDWLMAIFVLTLRKGEVVT